MSAIKFFSTTNIAGRLIAALIGNEERRFRQWEMDALHPYSAAIALPLNTGPANRHCEVRSSLERHNKRTKKRTFTLLTYKNLSK